MPLKWLLTVMRIAEVRDELLDNQKEPICYAAAFLNVGRIQFPKYCSFLK